MYWKLNLDDSRAKNRLVLSICEAKWERESERERERETERENKMFCVSKTVEKLILDIFNAEQI